MQHLLHDSTRQNLRTEGAWQESSGPCRLGWTRWYPKGGLKSSCPATGMEARLPGNAKLHIRMLTWKHQPQCPSRTLGSAVLSPSCNRVLEQPRCTLMPSDSISSTLMAGSRGPRSPLGPRRSEALRPALRWPQHVVRQVHMASLSQSGPCHAVNQLTRQCWAAASLLHICMQAASAGPRPTAVHC